MINIAGILIGLSLLAIPLDSAQAFGRKPVVVPPEPRPSPSPPPVTPADPSDVIRGRWEAKQRDGAVWSKHSFERLPALAPALLQKAPVDIGAFCPGYASLSSADQRNFWVYLLSAMSELESGHDPAVTYTENFYDQQGRRVVSRGLLQISIESGNSYGCAFQAESELHDPLRNLDCGLRILNKWISKDGRIAGKSGGWLGGARYWAVLRSPKVSTIQGWTQALPLCADRNRK